MLKKIISSFLVLLLIINGIACYSLHEVNLEDIEKTEMTKKYESANLTTVDDQVYYLFEVEVEESKIKGINSQNMKGGIIEFRKEEIKRFEGQLTKKMKIYENAKLTTVDDQIYYLFEVEVADERVRGIDSKDTQRGIIEFNEEDIKSFEIEKFDMGLSLLATAAVVGATIGVLYIAAYALMGEK